MKKKKSKSDRFSILAPENVATGSDTRAASGVIIIYLRISLSYTTPAGSSSALGPCGQVTAFTVCVHYSQ